jgi:hypothetical protein
VPPAVRHPFVAAPLQLVYAVLGLYATIALYFSAKSSAKSAATLRAMPQPEKPDYHTGASAGGPRTGWSGRTNRGGGGVQTLLPPCVSPSLSSHH